jgi:acetyl esterase
MSIATNKIVLEPAAQQVADAFAKPPFIYELDYPAARKILDDAQAAPIEKLPIDEEWITVPSRVGDARVRLIRPKGADGVLPVIVYMRRLGARQRRDP